jgi:hypothetical protein
LVAQQEALLEGALVVQLVAVPAAALSREAAALNRVAEAPSRVEVPLSRVVAMIKVRVVRMIGKMIGDNCESTVSGQILSLRTLV